MPGKKAKHNPPPKSAELAIEAWNMLRGVDWTGIALAVEMLGVRDVERFIRQFLLIRDFDAR